MATPNVEQPQVQDTTPKLQNMTAAARTNLTLNPELLTKYRVIFAMKSDGYCRTNRVYHRINMGQARPIQPLRRLRLAKQVDVGKLLKDMQLCGYQTVRQPLAIPRSSRIEDE